MGTSDNHMDIAKIISGPTLVLEKDNVRSDVLCHQLRAIGISQITVVESVEALESYLADGPAAMVICNIDIDSANLLMLLKNTRSTAPHHTLPFLTLTSGTDRPLIEQFVQARVSDIILTPLKPDTLKTRITRLLATSQSQHQLSQFDFGRLHRFSNSDLVASNQDSPTILVVDDIPDNLMLITSVFRKEFHLKLVKDGEKAIRICQSDNPPDLVLLDIMMPNLNGFDVARILREHPHSEHIPIVFMTALDDIYSRKRAMKLGAVDFITKPIDIEMLRFRIANLMRLVHARRGLQKEFDQMLELNVIKESLEFNIRYEIREPLLNAVHLLEELAADPSLNMIQKTQISITRKSVGDALELTRLATEIYQIETGTFVLKAGKVQLFDIFNRLSVQFKNLYAGKKLDIKLTKPKNYLYDELFIAGDEFLCYSAFQILIRLACEHAAPSSCVEMVCLKNPDSIILNIDSSTLLEISCVSSLFDKYPSSDNKEEPSRNGYHGKIMLEAHGANVTVSFNEATHQLNISAIFPQKADFNPYPE
jgi:two-component system sensor histidine kinase/response regulator